MHRMVKDPGTYFVPEETAEGRMSFKMTVTLEADDLSDPAKTAGTGVALSKILSDFPSAEVVTFVCPVEKDASGYDTHFMRAAAYCDVKELEEDKWPSGYADFMCGKWDGQGGVVSSKEALDFLKETVVCGLQEYLESLSKLIGLELFTDVSVSVYDFRIWEE